MSKKIAFVLSFFLFSSLCMSFGSHGADASDSYSIQNLNTGLSYMSIQEAINAPETSDGHTIFVDAGVYCESVVVNKSVSLVGTDKYTTIIDGNGSNVVIDIQIGGVSVSGLTVTHSYTEPEQGGGGLCVDTVGNVQISDIIACDNDAIGVHLVPGSHDLNITRVIIKNNSQSGLLLNKAWKVNVRNSTIVSNDGNGITIHNGGNHSIIGNNITNNLFGIYLLDGSSNNTISGNTIMNNSNGIVSHNSSNLRIQSNIIISNIFGIHCANNSMPELHWNDIYGNDDSNIRNDDPSLTINATYNYWGGIPDLGKVFGNVLYNPWLTESIFSAEITNPLPGETVSVIVTISANVNARNGVHKVEFHVDDQLEYTDYNALYTWNWNTTQYTETEHKIAAKAYDTLGLTISTSITVFVDNTPPTVSIKEPKPENIYYGTINVNVNASDNKELGNVYVRVDETGWLVMTYDLTDLLWKHDLNTAIFSDGQHTLAVLALDKASNPTTIFTTLFTDNNPPTLTIQSPQNGTIVGGASVIVSVQATDASGISEIEFYLEDVLVYTATDIPYQWSWDTTKYPNGEYTVIVKAHDIIGRIKTSEMRVTVRNVESPWWQTQFWTIIEVLIAIGGLLLGILTYLTKRKEGKDKN
jgi:parallel beta-helix repeat protein